MKKLHKVCKVFSSLIILLVVKYNKKGLFCSVGLDFEGVRGGVRVMERKEGSPLVTGF